jgi:hypothetical protein
MRTNHATPSPARAQDRIRPTPSTRVGEGRGEGETGPTRMSQNALKCPILNDARRPRATECYKTLQLPPKTCAVKLAPPHAPAQNER